VFESIAESFTIFDSIVNIMVIDSIVTLLEIVVILNSHGDYIHSGATTCSVLLEIQRLSVWSEAM